MSEKHGKRIEGEGMGFPVDGIYVDVLGEKAGGGEAEGSAYTLRSQCLGSPTPEAPAMRSGAKVL